MARLPQQLRALAASLALAASAALAAGPPAAVRSEIERLLAHLGSSPCEFYRNGSWHRAADAQAHLRRKYEYLADKGRIATTEDFIAKGATKSSTSGQAYQVRCPGQAARPSAQWLQEALQELRRPAGEPQTQ